MKKEFIKKTILILSVLIFGFGIFYTTKDITKAAGSSAGGGIGIGVTGLTITGEAYGKFLDQAFWSQHSNYAILNDYITQDILVNSLFGYETDLYIPSPYTKPWTVDPVTNFGYDFLGKCYGRGGMYYVITGHTLNFSNLPRVGDQPAIIILDTDYVNVVGNIPTPVHSINSPACIAIVSRRNGGTTLYSNNETIISSNRDFAYMYLILDNLHINGGYSSPNQPKSTPSKYVFAVPEAGGNSNQSRAYLGITINNSTISNISGNVFKNLNAGGGSDHNMGNIFINNVTTYNNTVSTDEYALFDFSVTPGNSNRLYGIVFNNYKSFDNIPNGKYNIRSRYGGLSINNSYFNPHPKNNNQNYNIFLDSISSYTKYNSVINNVVGNINNNISNKILYTHDIIGYIGGSDPEHFGYNKTFGSNTPIGYGRDYNFNGLHRNEGAGTNLGCLTRDYMINPTFSNYAASKYNRLSSSLLSSSGCVTESLGNTNMYTGTLKFSYGKDIPTQQDVAMISGNNGQLLVKLDIPGIVTNNYIASNIRKQDAVFSHSSYPLINGNSQSTVRPYLIPYVGQPTHYYNIFGPYVNAVTGKSSSQNSNGLVFTPTTGTHAVINQFYGNNNNFYAIHFTALPIHTGEVPPPTQGNCTFSARDLTISECSNTTWSPMYGYQATPASNSIAKPYRLLGYGNSNWVDFRDTAISYTAPRTPQTFTYTGQCRYSRNNSQGYQIGNTPQTIHIYVTDAAVSANNFSVENVGCGITVNWKTKSNANEGNCGNSDLTAQVYLDGSFGTCSIYGNTITYTPEAGQTNTDSCGITISDNDGNTKNIMITRYGASCITSGELLLNNGDEYTNDPMINVALTYNGTAPLNSRDLSCLRLAWFSPYRINILGSNTYTTTFDLSSGTGGCRDTIGYHTVYARVNDSTLLQDDILYDNRAPITTVIARNGTISIRELEETESMLSGSQQIKYKWQANGLGCPTSPNGYSNLNIAYLDGVPAVTGHVSTEGKQGRQRLCVYSGFYDRAGNPTLLASDLHYFVNKTGNNGVTINGSIIINNNDTYTNNSILNLTLSASGTNAIQKMQFSCDGTNWTNEITYALTYNLNLASSSSIGCDTIAGQKTVFVRYKDNNNNTGGISSDSIILDNTKPTVSVLSVSTGMGGTIRIGDTFSGLSGLQQILYRWHNTSSCPNLQSSYTPQDLDNSAGVHTRDVTIAPPTEAGTYYLCIYQGIYDIAGNSSNMVSYGNPPIIITPTSLQGSITINSGAVATNNKNLYLGLTSNARFMQFSCNQTTWTPQITFRPSSSLVLGTNGGCTTIEEQKKVYVKFISGSNSLIKYDTIIYDTKKPTFSTTQGTDSVNVTITDTNAGIAGGQKLKYRWNNSTTCPTTAASYTTQNLSYTNGAHNISPITISKPGNGTYYLCVLSGIADRAGNISDTQSIGSFCFGDNCGTPPPPTPTASGCRWSIQPTPALVGEINKYTVGQVAISCNVGIKSGRSVFGRAQDDDGSDRTNTGLSCDDRDLFFIYDPDILDIAECNIERLNGIQTITFKYKQLEERIKNISYTDTSKFFTLKAAGGAENYISGEIISDPIRFDFEGPNTEILTYEMRNEYGNDVVAFKIRDTDNRDSYGNISTCYYKIDFGNGEVQEGTRTCNDMDIITTRNGFEITLRAVDDLGNMGKKASTIIYPTNSNSIINETYIYTGKHEKIDNVEYFKGRITLRANHNNLGITKCEYTINGGQNRNNATLGDGYCEISQISPNQNFTGNFRVKTRNGEYKTGTSLYAVFDNTAPIYEETLLPCTGDYRCNSDQIAYFSFSDTGIGIDEYNDISCLIDQEGRNVNCSITGLKVCDLLKNCYTGTVTSHGINIDKTAPNGGFYTPGSSTNTLNCTTISINATGVILSGSDELSGLPTNYISTDGGSSWTDDNIIPIQVENQIGNFSAWIKDNAQNFTQISAGIDQIPPKILNSNLTASGLRFTGYECDNITSNVNALDEGCGGDLLFASFDSGDFHTGITGQTYLYTIFNYTTGANQTEIRTVPFVVKDNAGNETTGNLTLQWIDAKLKGSNFTVDLIYANGQKRAEGNRKQLAKATAGNCEEITATVISCSSTTITGWIEGDMYYYKNSYAPLTIGEDGYCNIEISDGDSTKIVKGIARLNHNKPQLNPIVVGGDKYIDRCYTGGYPRTNGTYLNDSNCYTFKRTSSNQQISKFTSGTSIKIQLNTTGTTPIHEYKIACIPESEYCKRIQTGRNNIGCDDITDTHWLENIPVVGRLFFSNFWNKYYKPSYVEACQDTRNEIAPNGANLCANMASARPNRWMTIPSDGIINFDLLSSTGCDPYMPNGSKIEGERQVWIQVRNDNANLSDKTPTDIIIYDPAAHPAQTQSSRYINLQDENWLPYSPFIEKKDTDTNDVQNTPYFSQTFNVRDMKRMNGIVAQEGTNNTENLIIGLSDSYLEHIGESGRPYTPYKIGREFGSERFVKGECTKIETKTSNFDTIINNSCTCKAGTCGSGNRQNVNEQQPGLGLTKWVPAIDHGCIKVTKTALTNVPKDDADNNKNYICASNTTTSHGQKFYKNCNLYKCAKYDVTNKFQCSYNQCQQYGDVCTEYEIVTYTGTSYDNNTCICMETTENVYKSQNYVSKDRCTFVCEEGNLDPLSETYIQDCSDKNYRYHYDCYPCTKYQCEKNGKCIKHNEKIAFFMLEYAKDPHEALLRLKKRNNTFPEDKVHLSLVVSGTNQEIPIENIPGGDTGYRINIQATNYQGAWPSQADIIISISNITHNIDKIGTYRLTIDTGLLTDFAVNPTNPLKINTNHIYLPSGNYFYVDPKFNINQEAVMSGRSIKIYTAAELGTGKITCAGNATTCPNFSCEAINTGVYVQYNENNQDAPKFETTLTINGNQITDTRQFLYVYDLQVNPLDPNRTEATGRMEWTNCSINFEGGGYKRYNTKLPTEFHVRTGTSPYKEGPNESEDYTDKDLIEAIQHGGQDNAFFFYISSPQHIVIGNQNPNNPLGVLGKILYELNFANTSGGGVADEFYYITGSAIIDGYKKELGIKRPTYNYANPKGYLFTFPDYDGYE